MKTPLKTVLKNFLDHVKDLEQRRETSDDQYEKEFQELKKLTDKLKEDPSCPCSVGLKDVNRPKNRYKDIVPYDSCRVILPKYEGIPGSDYINASHVKGASGALAYIAAQGPLPNTVIDFWRMIWVCNVQVIVMACNEKEAGKFKCEAYWPHPGEVREYGNISIELVNSSQICSDFLVRTFLVKCDVEMRDVYQFHYTSWPDHGVPDSVQPILDLVRMMRDCQASETVPIVVHCSAGCGRTGTICAVDYVWACLRHGKLDEDFSLFQIALELRRQRIAMIQTKEQYILAHRAVASMFEQQLRVIDCHIYENLNEDGEPLVWKERKGSNCSVHDQKSAPVGHNIILYNVKESEIESSLNARKNNSDSIPSKPPSTKTCRDESVPNGEIREISVSRNSVLSLQSNDDSIPFIDDDDVCIRPNCGRAYLDLPSCDSISKIVNCFDPFVDKLSMGTGDSSPEGDSADAKIKNFQISTSSSEALDRDSQSCLPMNSQSDITDPSEKSFNQNTTSNRESFPDCTVGQKHCRPQSSDSAATLSLDDVKNARKVGKATVVRRPSVSKLRSFFERSSPRSSGDSSKRFFFQTGSQNGSRAGSAPPSLNCMDTGYATERESVLMMVTRKFRSASVRSEREVQGRTKEKGCRRSIKDNLSSLTRTMSFNISKTFKSYSLSKSKADTSKVSNSVAASVGNNVAGTYKPKSPDSEKGNSTWYDRSSLPRAVAVVKPTSMLSKEPSETRLRQAPPPPPKEQSVGENASGMSKPAKIRDFFSSLNRRERKDSLTLWYNAGDDEEALNSSSEIAADSTISGGTSKFMSKTLPFLPKPTWKKVVGKSPLNSPGSPKSIIDQLPGLASSKFYTDVKDNEPEMLSSDSLPEGSKCPVPEEIIPLSLVGIKIGTSTTDPVLEVIPQAGTMTDSYDKGTDNASTSSELSKKLSVANDKGLDSKLEDSVNTFGRVQAEIKTDPVSVIALSESKESRFNPQIKTAPLKVDHMNFDLLQKDNKLMHQKNVAEVVSSASNIIKEETPSNAEPTFLLPESKSPYQEKKDIKECASRDKHEPESMKGETSEAKAKNISCNGVEQNLSTPAQTDTPPAIPKKMVIGKGRNIQSQETEKISISSQVLPEAESAENLIQNQQALEASTSFVSGSSENVDLYMNVNLKAKKNIEQIESVIRKNPRAAIIDLTSRESYSMEEELDHAVKQLSEPSDNNQLPKSSYERNVCAPFKVTGKFPGYEVIWPQESNIPIQKSMSANRVQPSDYSKLIDFYSCQNQAAPGYSPPLRRSSVGSNFMLSKSQSCGNLEGIEVEEAESSSKRSAKKMVKEAVVEFSTLLNQMTSRTLSEEIGPQFKPEPKTPETRPVDALPNDTVVDSVTLVTKSYKSGCSPQEEEIVFHFPPPPRGPPPKDDSPSEKFDIICKGGSLIVKDSGAGKDEEESKKSNVRQTTDIPLPAPRKSKQSDHLRRSASYTNISHPLAKKSGYENVFLDKYHTLSKLQIKSDFDQPKTVKEQKLFSHSKSTKDSHNYVNIADLYDFKNSDLRSMKLGSHNVKSGIFMKRSTNVTEVPSNSGISHRFVIDESATDSTYGRVLKVSQAEDQTIVKNVEGTVLKKKPSPSKKTERAPPPPNLKHPTETSYNDLPVKSPTRVSMIPKKLPSRKTEKAPPPPTHLAQKSISSNDASSSPQHHTVSSKVLDKHKLPAVHENITNSNHPKAHNQSLVSEKFGSQGGLSHSQSDVSVFLALRERRMQAANQERKVQNLKSIIGRKVHPSREAGSVSSSDSDSSYERIFLTREETATGGKKQSADSASAVQRKEIPVAPPRSKRRSIAELQYSQVKSKEVSPPKSRIESNLKDFQPSSASKEAPPAIPLKTKDAFEIP